MIWYDMIWYDMIQCHHDTLILMSCHPFSPSPSTKMVRKRIVLVTMELHFSPTQGAFFHGQCLHVLCIPSGKLSHNYGKIHHFSWENPLFLWSFSIANKLPEGKMMNHIWGFLNWGYPNSCMVLDPWMVYFMVKKKPNLKWMKTGGSTMDWKPPYIVSLSSSINGICLYIQNQNPPD